MEISSSPGDYEIKEYKKKSYFRLSGFGRKVVVFANSYGSFHLILAICLILHFFLDTILIRNLSLSSKYVALWGRQAHMVLWGANILPMSPMEPFRFISAVFLHGGFLHLFINMFSLYHLSRLSLEPLWGAPKTFLIFLYSGATANALAFFIKPLINSHTIVVSVGASGGIFGLMGALFAYFYFNKKISLQTKQFYSKRIFSIFILNMLLGLLIPNIDLLGHILGFIIGIALGFCIQKLPYSFYKQRQGLWAFLWLIGVLWVFVALIVSTINYWNISL